MVGGLGLALILLLSSLPGISAQEVVRALPRLSSPPLPAGTSVLPINLPTALKLADVRALDIALAAEQIRAAAARLDGSRALWLPSLFIGPDYFRHDGQLQDIVGNVFGTSKQQLQLGVGPYAVFSFSDALLAPLAARQVLRARQADEQAAANDTLLAVAEAYFTLQQARGELAGADELVRQSEDLVQRTRKLAPGLVPGLEVTRAETELARRQQTALLAQERWRVASAELVRILRLDPTLLLQPLEPPHLQVELVALSRALDELVPVALTNRPELASRQALVQASLQLMRQEKLRPLVPSLLLRGSSTPVVGTLAAGFFGGGLNSSLGNFSFREDWDVQLLWKLENLGFGNRALFRQRRAENKAALLEAFRIQDRVAAEVVQAHAQAQLSQARTRHAHEELNKALENLEQNLGAMNQTKRAGALILLVVRPQEVVAAVQALGQAYADYFGAVAQANQAQFRLYRALGQPAQNLLSEAPEPGDGQEPCRASLACPIADQRLLHPDAVEAPPGAPP
jgi:outer membrane protein TolC